MQLRLYEQREPMWQTWPDYLARKSPTSSGSTRNIASLSNVTRARY
jgi:hypothetical protein